MPQAQKGDSHFFFWLMCAFAVVLAIGVFLLVVGVTGVPVAGSSANIL